jgi:hypothetical protein
LHPAFERRLTQLQADLLRAEGAALARREALRALVTVAASIRRMLVQRGIDPADIAALRPAEAEAAELGDMPAGAFCHDEAVGGPSGGSHGRSNGCSDARGDGRAAGEFVRQLAAVALLHFGDGERPDPARSSLLEWHAWCLVTPASRHHPNILADPEVARYRQMLRLGSGASRWR